METFLFATLAVGCAILLFIDYRKFSRQYDAKPEYRKQQEWEDSQW